MTAAGEPARGAGVAGGGRLYVVATPIGNLGDVTHRSLEVLAAVPLIAAEDTRIARRLLARYAIETPLTSFHARSPATKLAELLDHLARRRRTSRSSPTPARPACPTRATSSSGPGPPGAAVVVPIPGASAVLAALVASGVAGPRWSFEGFLPRSGRERRERLARLAADPRPSVLFEAPSRVAATLADLVAACGPDRPAAVCRELTKLHEEIVRGSLAELAAAAARRPDQGPRGVRDRRGARRRDRAARPVEAPAEGEGADPLAAARAEVAALVAAGVARGEAARRVARARGISRRRLYDAPDEGGGRR